MKTTHKRICEIKSPKHQWLDIDKPRAKEIIKNAISGFPEKEFLVIYFWKYFYKRKYWHFMKCIMIGMGSRSAFNHTQEYNPKKKLKIRLIY